MSFHPAVQRWFERKFPHGPTEPQALGWPAIAAGHNTLIAAPTGTGKTLAGFLVCIDTLYRAAERGALDDQGTHVVYVSPLRALTLDVQHNLERPLAEIAEVARELGMAAPEIRVAVRSGDTEPSTRAAMLKRPPHVLITTPESLYLLLTAARSRELLRSTRTVIVDEIHALARDKRGAHLALSLERLEHLCATPPLRIGLSATQRPIERVARLLCGTQPGSPQTPRPCTVVDTGHRRALDLGIELPGSELEAVASTEQFGEVLDSIARHAEQRRTTLVFVNTRRLSERVAHELAQRLGEDVVAPHHGSLSKDRRQRVEERLRSGELRVCVATASLELGIDIGEVELVCQLGSPRSIATFLQRVGRSGHSRFATPVGRLYPLTRDELVECAALLRAVEAGRLDTLELPRAPLEVLAQQIVAECAAESWDEDALYAWARQATAYAELPREDFDAMVELVSDGVVTGRGKRGAYLLRDRTQGTLKGRRGARLAALTSGGAIPETADYRVIAEPDETPVGTINEDFAIESMAGDVFLLGSTSWRIVRVQRGTVRVVDAKGATPTIPFWLGEAPSRTFELSQEVSELRANVGAALERAGRDEAERVVRAQTGIDAASARELVAYLDAGRVSLGRLPTAQDLVFERFFDESGGMQLVLHSPLGGRINRALGLLLRKRFCTSFDFELQAAANDDALVLSLGPQHSFPQHDLPAFLAPGRVRDQLVQALVVTPMFALRWRANLTRALVVLRWKSGKRNPPALQRMEADDVMVALFPSLAACQDNAIGPREISDHALVRQTLDDCLSEAMDLEGVQGLLADFENGTRRLHVRETTEPSPLCHEILNSRPYTFLDGAPLEERRTRAVQVRRGLPEHARELAALDPDAIERVRAEAAPDPRDEDELLDLLLALGVCAPDPQLHELFERLLRDGRALRLLAGERELWCARELRAQLQTLFPAARFAPDLDAPASAPSAPPDAVAVRIVRGHIDVRGPTTVAELTSATALDVETVRAALAALELEGFALRGRFDGRVETEQFCARRLLARIHAYTQARLRREIEPVTAQDFMRFLLRHQHVEPGRQLQGRRGVLAAVAQLQGFELAASAWESEVLAARIDGYRPEWLDASCLSGELCWGRLGLRASRDEERTALLSRATPITLATRADLPWLLYAARLQQTPAEPSTGPTASVLSCLRRDGALFASELALRTGLSPREAREALWDGVARGLLTADGFAALRALLTPLRRADAHPVLARGGLRRGTSLAPAGEGRFARLETGADAPDSEALAEAIAEQLLARWGVVVRELYTRESFALPYRDVNRALRRLEARGVVRGGRFVTGVVGEQFALPEAVESLRAVRREERRGTLVQLSACDPLNLVSTIVPGTRVPAVRGNYVRYRDGAPVLEAAGASVQSASTDFKISGT